MNLKPLTSEERQGARERALAVMARQLGPEPTRRDFQHVSVDGYPPALLYLAALATLLLLGAFFTISAYRLFHMGSELFSDANPTLRLILSVCLVLGAEIGQVTFTLAAAVFVSAERGNMGDKRALYIGATLSTIIAVIGNVQQAYWPPTPNAFQAIEAFVPPLVFMLGASVLKHLALESIRSRHAADRAFEQALRIWQRQKSALTTHPDWRQAYANALRDALAQKNRRRAVLKTMTNEDWITAVWAEMQAEQWFDLKAVPEIAEIAEISSPTTSVAKADVVQYFYENPDAERLSGKALAEILGASEATISRAKREFQKNGRN